jgi:hypothetical protein
VTRFRVHMAIGPRRPRKGYLIPKNDQESFVLPSDVVDWTFNNDLWDRINAACESDIDDYEGVSLDPPALVKAAGIIRETLIDEKEISRRIAAYLYVMAEELDDWAGRGVTVMFSL